MPSNVEIKARVRQFDVLIERAQRLTDTPARIIGQTDTFFNIPRGRLKLREFDSGHGQLIFYDRPDGSSPRRSDYLLFETSDPGALKSALVAALGVRGRVEKVRHLYMVDQTRIHLDVVKGLGEFLELEVVLRPGQSEDEGRTIAESLIAQLGIEAQDLLGTAYVDLLETDSPTAPPLTE